MITERQVLVDADRIEASGGTAIAVEAMNTNIILGDIDYADDVIPFGNADRSA